VQECIVRGLQIHATEYIEIAQFDTRGTMSFHASVSPREASQWRRKNGRGIAVPGLRKNSLRATPAFQNWLLHLELLILHSFLESFLSGTDRDRQGLPTHYRVRLLEDWRNYLGCPAEVALRIGDGLSLNSGAVCFHLDHLNDPRRKFDQISWGSVCIPRWSAYLSEKLLDSMTRFGVPLQNTMFTVLCYGRAIIGSQWDRHEGVVDKTCPLFQCCMALIEDEIYETDFNTLDSLVARKNMMILLENLALDGSLNNYQYKGRYALLPECNNWYAFIGAFA
jgi:hypothetical protein